MAENGKCFLSEALNIVGDEVELIQHLTGGTFEAEGRHISENMSGYELQTAPFEKIKREFWCEYHVDFEDNKLVGHLIDPNWHTDSNTYQHSTQYAWVDIMVAIPNNFKKNKGGRPKAFDEKQLYAAIAAYFVTEKNPILPNDKLDFRQEMFLKIPEIRNYLDAGGGKQREQTVYNYLDDFTKHFVRAERALNAE